MYVIGTLAGSVLGDRDDTTSLVDDMRTGKNNVLVSYIHLLISNPLSGSSKNQTPFKNRTASVEFQHYQRAR